MVTNASEFFALAGLRRTVVEVRGQKVHIRELTTAERNRLLVVVRSDPSAGAAFVVGTCAETPDGKPLFSAEDAELLAETSSSVVDAVSRAVMKLSRLEEDDDDPKP